MSSSEAKDDIDLEDILSKFKLTGPYYMKMFVLVTIVTVINEMYYYNFIFAAADVGYRCKYECIGDTSNFTKLLKKEGVKDVRCYRFPLKKTGESCSIYDLDRHKILRCTEWVYDNPDSFVGEFNLGCQDWKRTLVGTIHLTGSMCGLFVIGFVSDITGRKKMIICTGIIGGLLGLTRSFVNRYWLYILMEMLESVFGDSCIIAYTHTIEMATKKKRVLFNSILQLTFGVADIIIACLAYAIPYWRYYLRTIYSLAFIFLLYWFVMDANVRWLLSTGRKTQAIKILKKAAKRENIEIDDETLNRLKYISKTPDMKLKNLCQITMKSRKILLRLLGGICMWVTCSFTFNCLLINSVTLEGNKFLNYGLTGAMYIPGSISLLFILSRFKRKKPLIVTFVLTGIFCVAQIITPKDYRWTAAALYFGGTLSASITFPIVYLYTTEIFPTYTRNTMQAICSSVGKIGGILAPQTPLLIKYWNGTPALPALIIAVLTLSTAVVTMLMPDTADDDLPENIAQAEAIGKKPKKEKLLGIRPLELGMQ